VESRPIAEQLFTWPIPAPPAVPALLGSQCAACSAYKFPASSGCPACGADDSRPVELATRGRLYTWTTQEFLPKAPYIGSETPETFKPWAIGYIELPGQLRVESRLYDVEPDSLFFGQEFELTIRPFAEDPDGTQVYAFGHQPISQQEQEKVAHA
jgi:uncharacterized OB-fold protein